jgi:alpha-pyrone synthase
MSFITSISLAVPDNAFNQSAIADFMERVALDEEQRRKIRTVFRASGIKTRHSVLADYGQRNGFQFYPDNTLLEPFPGTAQRMRAYQEHAVPLSVQAAQQALRDGNLSAQTVTHLITVSCTGMYAPGLDVDLIKRLPLPSTVQRICINFMGCFAAISALKTADTICQADAKATVLIVCTELCSLHFQKNFTDDNILANALFADGSAALLVQGQAQQPLLSIQGFYSNVVHTGADAMAWGIGDFGFEMRLSTYVPDILSQGIQTLVDGLTKQAQQPIDHFAIHPGGKKIIDVVGESLRISKEQLESSYTVLRDYGNMSSPSVLFVLQRLLTTTNVQPMQTIMGMAFGPGLTMESFLLKRI